MLISQHADDKIKDRTNILAHCLNKKLLKNTNMNFEYNMWKQRENKESWLENNLLRCGTVIFICTNTGQQNSSEDIFALGLAWIKEQTQKGNKKEIILVYFKQDGKGAIPASITGLWSKLFIRPIGVCIGHDNDVDKLYTILRPSFSMKSLLKK